MDVGVILKTFGTGGGHEGQRFKLSRYIGHGQESVLVFHFHCAYADIVPEVGIVPR